MLSTDDNNEIFWCKRAWKNFFPPAYSSGNFAHVWERDAARRRIIFIRDRLRQNKKEVHLPIFSSFPPRLRARNFSFFWRHQGGSLWPSCLFFLFQACRSQYAARACSVRAKNISAQPFLDYVMCVCVCIVPLAGHLLLLDVRLIIHAKCKKTTCKPSITDQLSSATGNFYFIVKVDAQRIIKLYNLCVLFLLLLLLGRQERDYIFLEAYQLTTLERNPNI